MAETVETEQEKAERKEQERIADEQAAQKAAAERAAQEKAAQEEREKLAAQAATRTRLARIVDLIRDHGTHEQKQRACDAMAEIGKEISAQL